MGRCYGADGAKGQRDLAKRLGVLENDFHREELASEGKFTRAADVAEIDGVGRIGGESFAASVIEAGDGIAEEHLHWCFVCSSGRSERSSRLTTDGRSD